MQKHQQLPDHTKGILDEGSRAELEELLATHEPDARDEVQGRTLLSFPDLPDDVIVDLVDRGLDIDTTDDLGATPLWTRVDEDRAEQIPLLLSLGADIQAATPDGTTPLHVAAAGLSLDLFRLLLAHGADPLALAAEPGADPEEPLVTPLGRAVPATDTEPAALAALVEIAETLLAAGDVVTSDMRDSIAATGEEVEDLRPHWEPAELAMAEPAMTRLYELFDVPRATARVLHDGVSPIIVPPGSPDDQFDALRRLLVPARGPAATAHGEAIRICEVLEEVTWAPSSEDGIPEFTRDHHLMAKALRGHLRSGKKLSRPERKEADRSLSQILDGEAWDIEFTSADGTPHDYDHHLAQLVVTWIGQNPAPLPVGRVKYEG